MKQLSKDNLIYTMSGGHAPQLRVAPGESFCLETEDCYGGALHTPEDKLSEILGDRCNPATGPVIIDGAKPGDILCIEIEDIQTRDYAIMSVMNGTGALGELVEGSEITFLPIRQNSLIISETLSVPLSPMIGVLAVAPAGADIPNTTPGAHGGNMDCKEIAAGSAVYLPVAVEGALLAAGDLHAVMGDGEVCICGAEVSGRVVLRTRVLKNSSLPTPCVETPDDLLFLASAETLDACERMVLDKTHRFLANVIGLSPNAAARIMSLLGQLRVCQVVDPLKTMKFILPKSALAALDIDDRLVEILRA